MSNNLPPMPNTPPAPASKPAWRRRRNLITAAIVAVAALAIAGTVVWMNAKSYDEKVADCKKALDSTASRGHRPAACEGVKQGDYDALLVGWTLKHLPKSDRDVLDYYDDGSIDGSIG
ncbi:hypothetical protein [Streptomyces sp. NPDC058466]|uniref:hypothetical protein n=1 Tax=Streptomyces sp. NPDC058466 TaxID=3346512 RepID=UPI00365F03CF